MTREVYSNKEFIEFSRSQIFVRVFQDSEVEGERLARKYRIEGFPTIIVLDSQGRVVQRILGGRPAPDLMELLQAIFDGHADPKENTGSEGIVL